MDFQEKQEYLNNVREMADEAESEEDKELLEQALKNLTSFIEDNTTHYIFEEEAPTSSSPPSQ